MEGYSTSSESQLQIRFITKQESFAVPAIPLSVPVNIDSTQLGNLLNELLKENRQLTKEHKFDFLILNELLRTPLIEHITERGASAETTVDVEYVLRTPAPQPQDALLHDDWIGSVKVAGKWILTGCYDNSVHIWSTKGKHQVASTIHSDVCRTVSWLKAGDPSSGFATGSYDRTILLWDWEPGNSQPKPQVVLRGHERTIDTISVSPDSKRLASGGWDTYVKLWSAALDDDSDEPSSKKSKGDGKECITRTPLHTLKGHKEAIMCALWYEPHTVCTASMDHTIKLWDTELCGLKNEIVGNYAFLGASWSPLANAFVACSADRHIRLYDPRSTEGTVCKSTFMSHTMWVTSVCWAQSEEHLFMSGSYDEKVKIWDTRSPRASLYDLSGHQGKVLCVDWSNPQFMVSGGADNSVNIFKHSQYVF